MKYNIHLLETNAQHNLIIFLLLTVLCVSDLPS